MGTATNVILGPCRVEINSVDIGFTRGDITVTHTTTLKEIKATQQVGTVRAFRTDETMTLAMEMLEVTLENIRIALNLPSANLVGSTLTLGYDNSCNVEEPEIVLYGVGPSCKLRTWTLYKCVASGDVAIANSAENEMVLPVTFIVLKDSTHNNNFGTIVDAT